MTGESGRWMGYVPKRACSVTANPDFGHAKRHVLRHCTSWLRSCESDHYGWYERTKIRQLIQSLLPFHHTQFQSLWRPTFKVSLMRWSRALLTTLRVVNLKNQALRIADNIFDNLFTTCMDMTFKRIGRSFQDVICFDSGSGTDLSLPCNVQVATLRPSSMDLRWVALWTWAQPRIISGWASQWPHKML